MLDISLPDWRTSARLIHSCSELPDWRNANSLYVDFETTSEQDKIASTNPWKNCQILGAAVVIDEERIPLYLPFRHRGVQVHGHNLDYENGMRWLQDVIKTAKCWKNHNIKYDAHVAMNEGLDISGPMLVDSLVLCKLAPYEERFNYGLDIIMSEWFFKNIKPYEEDIYLHLKKSKDYAVVPVDKMTSYACVDVLAVRLICEQLAKIIPEECARVVELETQLTSTLLRIERNGMRVDTALVQKHADMLPVLLFAIVREIEKLTGFSDMRPHTNADCKALIVEQLGLPVLEWTDGGKSKKKVASFGNDTLLAYKAMCPERAELFDWIIKYKEIQKLYTSFSVPYTEHAVNGYIHSDNNQIVRTGRLSGRHPNMMQLSPEAKEYIIPEPGGVIVDIDYSQIEFRLIAHFIKAETILDEYRRNPNADYHQIVADLCHIDRYPAKRVNFMLGYGGGRGKCIEILSSVPSIIGELKNKEAIENRAYEVYERYHKMVPTLKPTTYQASTVMRTRGYVRTLLGRRRYLPRKAHFKAFNSVIQGSAADLFKAATVRVDNYLPYGGPIKLIGLVHDSFVFSMPKELVETEVPKLIKVIEEIPEGINLRVPIRADAKWSEKHWGDCK